MFCDKCVECRLLKAGRLAVLLAAISAYVMTSEATESSDYTVVKIKIFNNIPKIGSQHGQDLA